MRRVFADGVAQAESDLSDKAKREELDAVINQARILVLKALSLPTTTLDSDPQLKGIDPPFRVRMRAQSKELLIEEEVRRRKYVEKTLGHLRYIDLCRAIKMNLANEGLEAKKKDEEVAAKKRKAEDDKVWEGSYALMFSGIIMNCFSQKPENSVSIAGVPSLIRVQRKRRRPKALFLDEQLLS